MTVGRATAYAWQGDLAAAAELAEEAIEAARLSGSAQCTDLGADAALLDRDARRRPRTRAEHAARRRSRPPGASSAPTGARSPPATSPRPSSRPATRRAAAICSTPQLPLVERAFQTRWYEVLTRAELALGRFPAAQRHADCADATSRGLGLPARTSEALRARAAVLLAAGDATGAARAAQSAAREAQRVGNQLDAARAHLLAGKALGGREATAALLASPRPASPRPERAACVTRPRVS